MLIADESTKIFHLVNWAPDTEIKIAGKRAFCRERKSAVGACGEVEEGKVVKWLVYTPLIDARAKKKRVHLTRFEDKIFGEKISAAAEVEGGCASGG